MNGPFVYSALLKVTGTQMQIDNGVSNARQTDIQCLRWLVCSFYRGREKLIALPEQMQTGEEKQ